MSEFSSFYFQAHMTKDKVQEFLLAPCNNLKDYADWEQWFTSQQRLYGDPIEFLRSFSYEFCDDMSVRVNQMIQHAIYNETEQLLILDNIHIGENFELLMQYMIAFRTAAPFVTGATEHNFMVIYPYWWGDRETVNNYADAYIEFRDGDSILTDQLNPANMQIATHYFTEHGEKYAQEYYDKYGEF